jgi:fumarate reductase flavoprotein subunit
MHEVLDTHNKPIPGLYAAGLEVSDMVGPTYSGWTSGYAFGFASYSGRHAALNAAKRIDGGKK